MKKMALVLCLVLLQGCGGGSSWTGSSANNGGGNTTGSALPPSLQPEPSPSPEPTPPEPSPPACSHTCCKCCINSQACGDSCIEIGETCHVPLGCACNPSTAGSEKLARIETLSTVSSKVPFVGVGKLELLSGLKYRSGQEEGICQQGTYTYEMDKPVSFSVGNIKIAEVGPGVNMRRLNLNNLNTDPKATINAARLLITLDKDADPYKQGIFISPNVNAHADGINLDLRTVIDLDNNGDIIELIGATTNTSNLVPVGYAKDYLDYFQNDVVKPTVNDQ